MLKELELIGILRRQDLGVAAELSDFQTACCQPRAAGNVLGVTELRGRDFFAAKISGRGELLVGLDHERRATIGRAGDEADLGAVGFGVGIQRRAGTHIGEIDRLREDRFHRAGPGIVNEPLDLRAGAEPFLEPAFPLPGKVMGHQALGVGDIWEVTDPKDGFGVRGAGETEDRREQKTLEYFHSERPTRITGAGEG